MAIYLDSYSNGAFTGAAHTVTYAHTITNGTTNVILIASDWLGGANSFSSATYNGSSMTQGDIASSGDKFTIAYITIATGDGSAHNVVITNTASDGACASTSVAYSGVDQTSPIDSHLASASAGSDYVWTLTLASVADNCWGVAMLSPNGGGTITAGTATTLRTLISGNQGMAQMFDNNGAKHPAGNIALVINWTVASTRTVCGVGVTLKPYVVPINSGAFFNFF